jgi:hypothetical protein
MGDLPEIALHPVSNCPTCGSPESTTVGKPLMPKKVNLPPGVFSIDGTPLNERDLLECRRCHTRYFNRVLDVGVQTWMFDHPSVEERWNSKGRLSVLRSRALAAIGEVDQFKPPMVLDIGCNTGSFIASLPAYWQKV